MEREPKIESMNEALKREILAMVEEDQRMRKSHEWEPEIDERNTKRIRDIIKQYGWPGRSLIGKEAADGVWLLIQHADKDVKFQKEALELLKKAVALGEADKKHEAYLEDRIRVNAGQPQIFGTQFHKDTEGNVHPNPIEDMDHIEDRRIEFGLGTFSEYKKIMLQQFKEFENKEKEKNNK